MIEEIVFKGTADTGSHLIAAAIVVRETKHFNNAVSVPAWWLFQNYLS